MLPRFAKRRFKFRYGQVTWDIDFFYGLQGTYIAVAEAEMPEGMDEPPRVLPLIEDHVAFKIRRDDVRFASLKLADEDYARALVCEFNLA